MEEKTLTKPFLFPRGNGLANAHYTGHEAEVTVNLDDRSLHLHDGSTQGGFTVGHLSTLDGGVLTYEETEEDSDEVWVELDFEDYGRVMFDELSPDARYIIGAAFGEISTGKYVAIDLETGKETVLEGKGPWDLDDTVFNNYFHWYGDKLVIVGQWSDSVVIGRFNPSDLSMIWRLDVEDRTGLGLVGLASSHATESMPLVVERRSYNDENDETTIFLERLDMETGTVTKTSSPIVVSGYDRDRINSLEASPQGDTAFLVVPTGEDTTTIYRFDMASLEPLDPITVPVPNSYYSNIYYNHSQPTNVRITHSGRYGVILSNQWDVLDDPIAFIVVDFSNGTHRTLNLPYYTNRISNIQIVPDGDKIQFTTRDGNIPNNGILGERRYVVYDIAKEEVTVDLLLEPDGWTMRDGTYNLISDVFFTAGGRYAVVTPSSGENKDTPLRFDPLTGDVEDISAVLLEEEWLAEDTRLLFTIVTDKQTKVVLITYFEVEEGEETALINMTNTRVFVRQ